MLSTKSTSYQNLHEEEKSKNHLECIKLLQALVSSYMSKGKCGNSSAS